MMKERRKSIQIIHEQVNEALNRFLENGGKIRMFKPISNNLNLESYAKILQAFGESDELSVFRVESVNPE